MSFDRSLLELIYEHDELADLDVAARRLEMRRLLAERVDPSELPAALDAVAAAVDGYGPLSRLMQDPTVTDVLINGPRQVWVEREGSLERTGVAFEDAEELSAWVARVMGTARSRVDACSPIADARLPDGSRLHVVLPPVAPDGPLVSIRRFPTRPSLDDLVAGGAVPRAVRDRLVEAVRLRRSILVSGATGTGKTTLLNALLAHVDPSERTILIEETHELTVPRAHAVSLIARRPNVEGTGALDLSDLVRAALRMRPDRIVVGEVRGAEAAVALDAMATGHEGSMLTVHARSGLDALDRLTTLALQAGGALDARAMRARVTRAVDLVVHLARAAGVRRVVEVCETG